MSDKVFVGPNVSDLDVGEKPRRISRVSILVDSSHQYTAGDDTGRTLEKTVPWGTQAMADYILAAVKNYEYQPFTGTDALLDPAAEIGDGITVGGTYSVLVQKDISFGKLTTTDISAPGSDEIEDEYPYISRSQREANRQLAQTYSYIKKTSEEIKLGVKNDMEAQSAEFTTQLGQIEASLRDDINELSADVTLKYDEFSVSLKNGLDGLSADFDLKLDGLETRFSNELTGQSADFQVKLDGLKATFEDDQKKQTASFEAGLSGLSASFTDELSKQSASFDLKLDGLETRFSDELTGQSADFQVKLDGLRADFEDSQKEQTASFEAGLDGLKFNLEDQIKNQSVSFEADLDGIRTRVTDAEGNISSLEQTATSLRSDISSLDGKYSSLEQTVDGFETTVSGLEGKYSSLKQTVDGFETTVSGLDDKYSTMKQTVDGIQTTVSETVDELGETKQYVSTVEQYAKSIRLSVTNGTDSSTFQLTAGTATLSSGTIKITGMVTFTDLKSNSSTVINGDYITTGKIGAKYLDLSDYSNTNSVKSLISGTVEGIELSVTNGTTSSSFKLTSGSTTLSSGEIKITGMVTFTDLKENSKTVINGDYITTGKIKADYIDVDNLKFQTLWGSSVKKAILCSGSYIYIGGDSISASYDYLYLYGSKIRMSSWASGSPTLTFNFDATSSTKGLIPGTSGVYNIGTSSSYFGDTHVTSVVCHDGTHNLELKSSSIISTVTASSIGSSTYPWNNGYFKNLYVNGSKFDPGSISVNELKNGSYSIKLGTTGSLLPSGTTGYVLGSTTYPFNTAYFNNLYVRTGSVQLGSSGGSYGSSKVGFFGASPIAQLSISTTSQNQGYTSATSSNYLTILNNIAGILKKYGLVSS